MAWRHYSFGRICISNRVALSFPESNSKEIMSAHTESFSIRTKGKGTYEITSEVESIVRKTKIQTGTATVFIQHTSASLIIYENADRSARVDLEKFFDRLVPEDEPYFIHNAEGPDDMPSHIRMVLTRTSEVIPIASGRLCLGTWQGIFIFEHRAQPHERSIQVAVVGD
jgi:secondary thiamine-phosphate synthase enzyme